MQAPPAPTASSHREEQESEAALAPKQERPSKLVGCLMLLGVNLAILVVFLVGPMLTAKRNGVVLATGHPYAVAVDLTTAYWTDNGSGHEEGTVRRGPWLAVPAPRLLRDKADRTPSPLTMQASIGRTSGLRRTTTGMGPS